MLTVHPHSFAMTFKNGWTISVAFGKHNYCGNRFADAEIKIDENYVLKTMKELDLKTMKGLEAPDDSYPKPAKCHDAEIAIFFVRDDDSDIWLRLPNGNEVEGWLSADKVGFYITIASGLPDLENTADQSWREGGTIIDQGDGASSLYIDKLWSFHQDTE